MAKVTPKGFSEASWSFLDLYVNQNFFKMLNETNMLQGMGCSLYFGLFKTIPLKLLTIFSSCSCF